MSKKIVITEEQDAALAKLINQENGDYGKILESHIKQAWVFNKCLNSLSIDEMARILYSGGSYEVVPSIKAGSFIVRKDGLTFSHNGAVAKVEAKVVTAYADISIEHGGTLRLAKVRLATPEEAAHYKVQEVFFKLGRSVGQFDEGDFGFITNGGMLKCVYKIRQAYTDGKLLSFYPSGTLLSLTPNEDGSNTPCCNLEATEGLMKSVSSCDNPLYGRDFLR